MASAMALSEEELSAMLKTSHPGQGHMSMSLSNEMPSSNSMELLSGQLPFSPLQRAQSIGGPGSMSMQRGGLERSMGAMRSMESSMGSLGSGGSASSMSQASQWPFASDEKWELDEKNEVLDSAAMGRNGGRVEAHLQPLNELTRQQGLQRFHSAPSSFLQTLADFNEEAFSHTTSPSPLGNNNNNNNNNNHNNHRDDHLNFFNENLAPIMESAPSRWTKQPEPEKVVPRSNPMSSTEQYVAIQAENARQSALRDAQNMNSPSANMESLSRSQNNNVGLNRAGLGGGASDFRSQTLNNNLLRQSSSPAELLAAINERQEDLQHIRSQEDSLSAGSFRENRANKSMYVFNDAMTGGGGVWKMPTSPAGNPLAGKRVRFPEEMTDDSDLHQDGSQQHSRGGRTGSLTRHQSLPTSNTPLDPIGMDMGYDDILDLYSPCKTRARRGYATHPRSIAERNRRSRISERMKKLQDLVPNMDKQTNTADMLDEAVEYVKHLQLQVKDLSATIVQLKNGIKLNAG